jgi:hypothetical protein
MLARFVPMARKATVPAPPVQAGTAASSRDKRRLPEPPGLPIRQQELDRVHVSTSWSDLLFHDSRVGIPERLDRAIGCTGIHRFALGCGRRGVP